MKIPFDTFKTVVCRYMDTDIIDKAPRNRRLLLGIGVMLAPTFLDKQVNEHLSLLCTLGVIDEEKQVDVDTLEDVTTKLIDKYGSYQMNVLDMTIDLTKEDVAKLSQMCRNAQA